MAKTYPRLHGASKISSEWPKINEISQNAEELEQRVDTIINEPDPNKDAELVDIRTPDPSYTPERQIDVAGDMTRDMQAQFATHKAQTVMDSGGVHGLYTEFGTFTPELTASVDVGPPSYGIQTGHYYVIGDLVKVDIELSISEKNSLSGNLRISGLPFSAVGAAGRYHAISIGRADAITLPNGGYMLSANLSPNATSFNLLSERDGQNTSTLNDTHIADSFRIQLSILYQK